jgi:hypothetical protein
VSGICGATARREADGEVGAGSGGGEYIYNVNRVKAMFSAIRFNNKITAVFYRDLIGAVKLKLLSHIQQCRYMYVFVRINRTLT